MENGKNVVKIVLSLSFRMLAEAPITSDTETTCAESHPDSKGRSVTSPFNYACALSLAS